MYTKGNAPPMPLLAAFVEAVQEMEFEDEDDDAEDDSAGDDEEDLDDSYEHEDPTRTRSGLANTVEAQRTSNGN